MYQVSSALQVVWHVKAQLDVEKEDESEEEGGAETNYQRFHVQR